jgi:hypothetical protein
LLSLIGQGLCGRVRITADNTHEREKCEAVKMKPKFQDGNVRKVGYMPRNSATNEWSQLKKIAMLETRN